MTQEDRELLLKDLCARLPYHPTIRIYNDSWEGCQIGEFDNRLYYHHAEAFLCSRIEVKPYLRPMSSMTEEEKEDYRNECNRVLSMPFKINGPYPITDWLNAHHFDYRGLIEKGLALEAPEGMYNKRESGKGSDIPVPKTVDEAISTLEKILSDEDREYLLENGAISMHNSLGRWIRNEWGLWTGSELKDELMNLNKGLNHPDDMSNYIIEEFIKYWNNKL